jgi:hypothetical protein
MSISDFVEYSSVQFLQQHIVQRLYPEEDFHTKLMFYVSPHLRNNTYLIFQMSHIFSVLRAKPLDKVGEYLI